jgi:hypothetical protein
VLAQVVEEGSSFGVDALGEAGSSSHELPVLEVGLIDPATPSIGGQVAIGQNAPTDRDQGVEDPTRSGRWLAQAVEQFGARDVGERIPSGGITPVDHHWCVPVAEKIPEMEVPMTEPISLRQLT